MLCAKNAKYNDLRALYFVYNGIYDLLGFSLQLQGHRVIVQNIQNPFMAPASSSTWHTWHLTHTAVIPGARVRVPRTRYEGTFKKSVPGYGFWISFFLNARHAFENPYFL